MWLGYAPAIAGPCLSLRSSFQYSRRTSFSALADNRGAPLRMLGTTPAVPPELTSQAQTKG